MNSALLKPDVQDFIRKNFKADVSKIAFKGSPFKDISTRELAEQISGRRKAEKKLPTWFKTEGIVFPPSLNLEQTSSENTAAYKASLISGKNLADLTGGFGVDSFFFSKKVQNVRHFELNESLSKIVAHNFKILEVPNVEVSHGDGLSFLEQTAIEFDWLYLDPSRRTDAGGRIFQLSDCLPNVPEHLDLLLKKSKNIMVKTSPLLDLQAGIRELKNVATIHIVAVENEVKELLWILGQIPSGATKVVTVNLRKKGNESFNGIFGEPANSIYSKPLSWLYEPNAAIMKSGLFDSLSEKFKLAKLHPNSHLFTSEKLKDNFPGRQFQILEVFPYQRKTLKAALNLRKANITTRNFPESVEDLRKKLKIKEGGEHYLFFTTTAKDEKICIVCAKA